jgi:ABC-2 type transport system ATP-binding protein
MVEGARALDGVAGFVEEPRFYPYLSGRKNLELLAAFDGGEARSRIDEVLDLVELADRDRDRVGGYSHGMRQRLGIAAALLRAPHLLLLDEPTTGLEPAGMRDMRELVRRLVREGITIMLSSHLLAEVEELCDHVAILRAGRVVFEGGLEELRRSAASSYVLRTTDNAAAAAICRAEPEIADLRLADGQVRFAASPDAVAALSIALGAAGIGITALLPQHASLEELFFRLTEDEGPDGRDRLAPEPAGQTA